MSDSMMRHRLSPLLAPRSVAVMGASPRQGTVGNRAVRALAEFGFPGAIYPLHPEATSVCDLPAYRGLDALPEVPDCLLLAISAEKAVPALEAAAARGVKAAVLFASGFAETDDAGRARQATLRALADRTGLVVCGPNCLGLANIGAHTALYSAPLPEGLQAGGVAVLSHSGSGCILLSNLGRFGLSYLVSVGNAAVLDVADYLDFLAEDPATRIAALFIETVRDPAAFAAACRKMRAAGKSVVALKVGRSAKGAAAAAAHTGSLAGAHEAYADFFRRCGVIAVDDLDELVESVALMLAVRQRPRGRGVGIMNVSGGEIALTCDIAERIGLDLPELAPESKARIQAALPHFGTASNPLDATGVAVFDHAVYRACIEGLAADPAVELVAVSQDCPATLGSRQAATYAALAATAAAVAQEIDKPLVFYSNVAAGVHPDVAAPLEAVGVPVLRGARASLLAIRRLVADEAPAPVSDTTLPPPDPSWAARLATGAKLTEREAKSFLAAHGIQVTRERFAATAAEAVAAAQAIGFPVVLKIESPDLPHKSDIGGVRLGLTDAASVAEAFAAIMAAVTEAAPTAQRDGVVVQEMIPPGIEALAGLTDCAPLGPAGDGGLRRRHGGAAARHRPRLGAADP